MGFEDNIAQKAYILTGGVSLESALEWIDQNQDKPDYHDPIDFSKPSDHNTQLTPEEAKLRARELQKEIRMKMKLKEEQQERENEKQRIQMGKEMTEARRKIEEQQNIQYIEKMKREKDDDAKHKIRVMEQLERDKRNRFGGDYKEKEVEKMTPKKSFERIWEQMRKVYVGQSEIIKTCLSTLNIYLGNLAKEPNNDKFRQINGNNPNFQARVGNVVGGTAIIKECGYSQCDDGYWRLEGEIEFDKINGFMAEIDEKLLVLQ